MKILSQHDYEQMWQANGYSLLASDLGVPISFEVKLHRLCSFSDRNWFLTYDKNVGSMYYSQQEMELAEYWGRKDFLNQEWFLAYIRKSEELYKEARRLFDEYNVNYLEGLDKDELYLVVREAGFVLSDVYAYFNASQPQCVRGLEKDLTVELEKVVPIDKVREVLLDLTRSSKRTMLEDEEVAWLKLCTQSPNDNELKKILDEHSRIYGVLGTADGGEYYDVDYYVNLYEKVNSSEAQVELDNKLAKEEEIEKRKNEIGSKYKVTNRAKEIASVIAETGHNRFELRLYGWMPLDYWFTRLLVPFLEKRSGVATELLRQLTFQELLQFLLTDYIDETEMRKRDDFFIVGMASGLKFIESGSEARKLSESLVPNIDRDAEKFEGQIAQAGEIEGKAYVLHWDSSDLNKEMQDMPKGSILVAGQTRPQLMPAIKKAAAIVTDEGGITSHAAIVSRELGIPCVIGTKTATKIIKTGDTLKVDANNGVVEILNKGDK